jgi:serine/threonine protein phosphatase PrpC
MRFAAGNAQHIGARPQQQDAFGFSDPSDKAFVAHGGFLGVVADGMGGLTHGSEASSVAVRSFLQAYKLKTAKEPVADALARSLQEANRVVLQVAGDASPGAVGTTLAAAVALGDSLHWIAAGDSRIYWLHGTSLTRLTADHVYATKLNREVAQGKISPSEAQTHSERASLTSYLGQNEPELVDRNIRPLAVQPDDCVILCSDGLYRAVAEGEIVGAFRGDLQRGCDSLVQQVLAKQRKQQDNLTIIGLKSSTRTRSVRIHPARVLFVTLVGLLLASLSGGAGYWYGRYSAIPKETSPTVQPTQPPPAPSTTGDPDATKPVAGPPKQTKPAAKKQPERHEQKPNPKNSDSKNKKPKVDAEKPKVAVPNNPEDEAPPEQTTPAPQQGGAAEGASPDAGKPGNASQGSSAGQQSDKENDKKPGPPATSPETTPNPPNPTPPSHNLARGRHVVPRFDPDNASGLRESIWLRKTKGVEPSCRS